ncbi:MAG: hypothetical protein A3B41_05105 [Candidatus Levybacteria bacterium RIFCSPLOWO2_01_FULL_37_26]|nr:MAG: hypothetical protein A3B41_05105 [Candidatus Levybacteria bacterium RIFCSPLOWO2_01_FULL_37_26]
MRPQEQERRTPELWVHTANFLPWTTVVSNETLVKWTESTGADKMEWIAAGKGPVGPAYDVLVKPVAALQKIFGERLGGGHVIFNPYATVWSMLGRRPDPLRPKRPIALYNMLLASKDISEAAIHKLNEVNKGNFPVVVYPPFKGRNIFGQYENMRYQTHPAVFNDNRDAGKITQAVKNGDYSGVCVDLYHFQEATDKNVRPFGVIEDELKRTLETFREEGVLKEIHVQPGRREGLDKRIGSDNDLRAMLKGSYRNSRLGRLLTFLVRDLGFMGPYTLEIDPRSLAKIYGKGVYYPPSLGGSMFEAQRTAVDYVRRA